jgi:hypothetical protein
MLGRRFALKKRKDKKNMSMIGNFLAVTEMQLKEFIKDNDLLEKYIYPDNPDENSKKEIDVDKAWQAIHYILAKDPEKGTLPESLIVLGGTEIGDDFGYGPAFYINASEVKQVSEILNQIDFDKIKKEYNPQQFEKAKIYPQGIWFAEKEEALEYVLHYLKNLIVFYAEAAKNNMAMIKYIN